jgi:hypothetical protein
MKSFSFENHNTDGGNIQYWSAESFLSSIGHRYTDSNTEMKYLDINLTKDSSLLLMLFTVPSTGGFHRKPYSSLATKILPKNPRNKKLESTNE